MHHHSVKRDLWFLHEWLMPAVSPLIPLPLQYACPCCAWMRMSSTSLWLLCHLPKALLPPGISRGWPSMDHISSSLYNHFIQVQCRFKWIKTTNSVVKVDFKGPPWKNSRSPLWKTTMLRIVMGHCFPVDWLTLSWVEVWVSRHFVWSLAACITHWPSKHLFYQISKTLPMCFKIILVFNKRTLFLPNSVSLSFGIKIFLT